MSIQQMTTGRRRSIIKAKTENPHPIVSKRGRGKGHCKKCGKFFGRGLHFHEPHCKG
jgi:hypothetical protein